MLVKVRESSWLKAPSSSTVPRVRAAPLAAASETARRPVTRPRRRPLKKMVTRHRHEQTRRPG